MTPARLTLYEAAPTVATVGWLPRDTGDRDTMVMATKTSPASAAHPGTSFIWLYAHSAPVSPRRSRRHFRSPRSSRTEFSVLPLLEGVMNAASPSFFMAITFMAS